MEGLFFLAGLIAIVWLAYWIAQEGRQAPGAKRRWSPFDWREDIAPPVVEAARRGPSWRDRPAQGRRSVDRRR